MLVIYQYNPFRVPKTVANAFWGGGRVRNFLGGMSQGASIAWTLFSILIPVLKFNLLLQDACESLLVWHCTLPDVLVLTPPFADDLAGSGFWVPTWQILLTCLHVL